MNAVSTIRFFIKKYFPALLLIGLSSTLTHSIEIDNAAIRFYISKADSVLNESVIFNKELVFSVTAGSIYGKIDYRGLPDRSDTAKFLLEIQNKIIGISGIIDSSSLAENSIPGSLIFDKPWDQNCSFYFFPRDTGVGDLAIGFEPRSGTEIGVPSGMIILDRDSYAIRRIYLYYQTLDEYLWLSKTYQFSEDNQVLLLKTLTIQGCFFGFFQRRYFRQDISFDNYSFR